MKNNCIDEKDLVIAEYNFDYLINISNGFKCGNEYLDSYIYNEDIGSSGLGKTYFYINKETNDIVGYFTICATAISLSEDEAYEELRELKRKMLIKFEGALGIKCFAINEEYSGKVIKTDGKAEKLSDVLLDEAISYLEEASDILGSKYIVLHSTQCARNLYLRHGFEFLDYKDRQLYEMSVYGECKDPNNDEKERLGKYILNISKCEISTYPMICKIK